MYEDESNHAMGMIAEDIDKLPESERERAWVLVAIALRTVNGGIKLGITGIELTAKLIIRGVTIPMRDRTEKGEFE